MKIRPYEPSLKAAHVNSLLGEDIPHKRLQRLTGKEIPEGKRLMPYTPESVFNIRARLAGLEPDDVRAAMAKNKKKMPSIIVVRMTKGGVGKTSVTVNLATALALKGFRCLVIDADHQATATNLFGIDDNEFNPNHIGVLLANVKGNNEPDDLSQFITPIFTDGYLDLIPSDVELDSYNSIIFAKNRRETVASDFVYRNREYLAQNYDVILVDTNPGTSQISFAFMHLANASQRILTVVEPEGSCLRALNALKANLIDAQIDEKRPIDVSILLNKTQTGRRKSEENMQLLIQNYGDKIIHHRIPNSVAFSRQVNADNIEESKPVTLAEPNNKVSETFFQLTSDIESLFNIKQPGYK